MTPDVSAVVAVAWVVETVAVAEVVAVARVAAIAQTTPAGSSFLAELGPVRLFARLVSAGAAALAVAGVAAALFRSYFRTRLPEGLAVLFGVSAVGVYLNTLGLLRTVGGFESALGGTDAALFDASRAAFSVGMLLVAGLASPVGARAGDRLAVDVVAVSGGRELDAEVSRLVRSVGRVTAVELPEEIEDVDGYDPIDDDVKARLAGRTLLFPTRLTVAALRERLVARLKQDYGVGHVDLDLEADGTITYLALGLRAAGLGPSLAPGTAAVAVRADPPNGASPGDRVQVWSTETGPSGTDPDAAGSGATGPNGAAPTRVVTGELRAVAGDVATVVVDADDARALGVDAEYRLVTLPAEAPADRAFVSLLRAAEETVGVVRVEDGSPLVGRSVADLGAMVAALRADGTTTVPARDRALAPGDELFVVGRPEALRRLEAESAPVDGAGDADGDGAQAQPS